MHDEAELTRTCGALVARTPSDGVAQSDIERLRAAIHAGEDPLGEAFTRLRSAAQRRSSGAVYTPASVVRSMLAWLRRQGPVARVVDPGAGSGRFLLAAAALFPEARLVAIESDRVAAQMLRANLAVRGWLDRTTVIEDDYRQVNLEACDGVTAFIGNPPYVRHHGIEASWKRWYVAQFAGLGIRASALAGLHLHFFLHSSRLARAGDLGAFITPAEWLDVNYGAALRELLLSRLGAVGVHVLRPAAEAFPGTATTSAITCFKVGECREPVRLRSVDSVDALGDLQGGAPLSRAALHDTPRWSTLLRPAAKKAQGDTIELGELLRVHRGQVTGSNPIWIDGQHAARVPARFKWPTVTRAKELIAAGASLASPSCLRRVIDLPPDLDALATAERAAIEAFLLWARRQGAADGYVASHRKAWWSVGLRAPAPILCTYMARRPPQFTLNECAARHINVAHGLYPRAPLTPAALSALVAWLNANVGIHEGRVYAGGLTKFEPREIERLRIPTPEALVR